MPKIEKKSTLLRQWEMMRMLTVSRFDTKQDGRWDKAGEIATRLNEMGYEVSVRTVQRDLLELSTIFPIELNDKNPRDYGWRWIKGANLAIPGMSVSEALAMRLVETHLKQILPDTMLEGLQGVFSLAKTKLDEAEKQNNNYSKDSGNRFEERKAFVLGLLKQMNGKQLFQTRMHLSRGRYDGFIQPLFI